MDRDCLTGSEAGDCCDCVRFWDWVSVVTNEC